MSQRKHLISVMKFILLKTFGKEIVTYSESGNKKGRGRQIGS